MRTFINEPNTQPFRHDILPALPKEVSQPYIRITHDVSTAGSDRINLGFDSKEQYTAWIAAIEQKGFESGKQNALNDLQRKAISLLADVFGRDSFKS